MKLSLAVILALIVGVLAGLGTAALRMELAAWDGNPAGPATDPHQPPVARSGEPAPRAMVDQAEYDFGTMDYQAEGSHDFVIRNVGDAPLVLTAGDTSCRCTVSEIENGRIAPGQSDKVTLTWTGEHKPGPYRQTATVFTNDPARPRVTLAVSGRLTAVIRLVPDELVFSTISVGEPATGEVRLFCCLPEPLKIIEHECTQRDTADYFAVTFEPLSAEELREEKEAQNGLLMKVAVKPGLPQGRFQQTIRLRTNLPSLSTLEVPVEGLVQSDISIVGRGWDAESGVLHFGSVSSQLGAQRRLMLIVRGPYRKQVTFKPVSRESDQLRVTLGETTEINKGVVTQTPLVIEIPKGSHPANHFGSEQGDFGQVIIQTNHPQVPKLRIQVRFGVVE